MSDLITPEGVFGPIDQAKLSLTFCGSSEKAMVTIHADGSLEYGVDYTPDAAAKAFWEAVNHHSPHAEILRLCAENEKLRAALKPFYEWERLVKGSQYFDTMPDEKIMLTTGSGETDKWIYRKHLRAAAAALNDVKSDKS